MGSPFGQRATVRATGNNDGFFRGSVADLLPAGTAEMTLVITGVPRTATIAQTVIDHLAATNAGFKAAFAANVMTWDCGTGAAVRSATTRALAAGDVGKLTRFVLTCSVVGNAVQAYMNCKAPNVATTIAAYSGGSNLQTVLDNSAGSGGCSSFEVVDIALLEGLAFSAAQVRTLDAAILAAGGVPRDYAPWTMHLRIGDLAANKGALDAGGQSAGLVYVRSGTPLLGAFDQSSPASWGPTT